MKHFITSAFVSVSIWILIGPVVCKPLSAEQLSGKDNNRILISLNAEQMYQSALRLQDVWWEPGDVGIHLTKGTLIQNDSPGCGRRDDDAGVFEVISERTILTKDLDINEQIPQQATIVFIGKEKVDNTNSLEVVVNGKVISVQPSRLSLPDAKQYQQDLGSEWKGWSWSRWHYVDVPVGYLRKGRNQILFRSGNGEPGWAVMVADYADFHKGCTEAHTFPQSSSKSEDGGKTWRQNNLGSGGNISGEYVIRIFLGSFRSSGLLVSPVIDAAGEENLSFKTRRRLLALKVKMEQSPALASVPGALSLEVRSGDSPLYNSGSWSEWIAPRPDNTIRDLRGRYVQWRIKFSSHDPEESPQLTHLTIEGDVAFDAIHAKTAKLVREHNVDVVEGPQGYTYEDYRSVYLEHFRRRFKLDDVVAGAKSEWDRQLRLLHWAYLIPVKKNPKIFPWDPNDWAQEEYNSEGSLVMNEDKHQPREVMCLFPNLVLMAALQSLGYPARHINLNSEGMSGHEIVEVWSNEYDKWVYLDAQRDFYWYDKKTHIPVSTLEIHQVLANQLRNVETWHHPFVFTQQPQLRLEDLPIAPAELYPPYRAEDELFVVATSSHLRMVPRNDMFSNPSPIPVSQGREVWCWDGYLNWADSKVPPLEQFSHYTNRAKDFDWPLNQVRYTAEETSTPGTLDVSLENDMPYLKSLLARFDGKQWRTVDSHFQWKLQEGANTFEVRGINTAGVEGPISSLTLGYQP